jgi:hypothetical protein
MNTKLQKIKKSVRSVLVIAISVFVVVSAIRFVQNLKIVQAGNIGSTEYPAATFYDLSQIYAPLISTSYDSSSVTASSSGNALELIQCAITRATGGSCP